MRSLYIVICLIAIIILPDFVKSQSIMLPDTYDRLFIKSKSIKSITIYCIDSLISQDAIHEKYTYNIDGYLVKEICSSGNSYQYIYEFDEDEKPIKIIKETSYGATSYKTIRYDSCSRIVNIYTLDTNSNYVFPIDSLEYNKNNEVVRRILHFNTITNDPTFYFEYKYKNSQIQSEKNYFNQPRLRTQVFGSSYMKKRFANNHLTVTEKYFENKRRIFPFLIKRTLLEYDNDSKIERFFTFKMFLGFRYCKELFKEVEYCDNSMTIIYRISVFSEFNPDKVYIFQYEYW